MSELDTPFSRIDALSRLSHPYAPLTAEEDRLFEQAMQQADRWHLAHNPAYAALWRQGEERPVLPVGLFKRMDLNTAPGKEPGFWLTSSGTGGQGATSVYFDDSSLARMERGMRTLFAHNGMMSQQPANFLVLSPDPSQGEAPGYARSFARFTACAPVKSRVFAVRDNRLDARLAWKALQQWSNDTAPIFIFGLTVFFEHLCLEAPSPFEMKAVIRGITGGGWKGLTQSMTRDESVQGLQRVLQAPEVDIRDIYGTTEQGVHYLSCREGHFHIPAFSRFSIVAADGEALPEGEEGLIHLQNPFLTSLPSHDILMEDIGVWGSGCSCGEPLPFIRFLGRLSSLQGGCAYDALS